LRIRDFIFALVGGRKERLISWKRFLTAYLPQRGSKQTDSAKLSKYGSKEWGGFQACGVCAN